MSQVVTSKRRWIGQVDEACALISLLNAGIYHGLSVPRPGTDEFDELMDLVGAVAGPAIRPELVLDRLGLTSSVVDLNPANLLAGLPIELSVRTEEFGFHSTLIVGMEPKKGGCHLTMVNLSSDCLVSSVPFKELGTLLSFGYSVGSHLAASIQPAVKEGI